MTVQVYDFNKPGRLPQEVEQRLARWLRAACSLATPRWAKQLPFPVEMTFQGLDTARSQEALAAQPESGLGYRVSLPGAGQLSLAALPRSLVLPLIAGLMGETVSEPPAERDLTPVEDALLEYLLSDLLLRCLQETWPTQETFTLQLGPREPSLRWSRIYPAESILVVGTFGIKGPFGEQSWQWLLPQTWVLARLGGGAAQSSTPEDVRPRLEALVTEMPVEVSVTLGTVELPLAEVAQLQPGDVVILNQRVTDPLPAEVAGVRKFRAWPGRVATRQAIQIANLSET